MLLSAVNKHPSLLPLPSSLAIHRTPEKGTYFRAALVPAIAGSFRPLTVTTIREPLELKM